MNSSPPKALTFSTATVRRSAGRELDRTVFPDYSVFSECCRRGMSAVVCFKPDVVNDPNGWKFGRGWPPSHAAFGRMRALLALEEASRLSANRVLEVAAGGGVLSTQLATNNCDVVINDLNEENLTASLRELQNGDRVRINPGNVFDLSPEDIGRFDLVIACEVIEHVAHPDQLLAHLRTFLEPGGQLLLTSPNGSYFRNRLPTYSEVQNFEELEAKQFKPDADGHLFLLTPSELCELAASVGLRIKNLSVWGTPLLTGHGGLRYLTGRFLLRGAYLAELMAQRLPAGARARACVAISATMSVS